MALLPRSIAVGDVIFAGLAFFLCLGKGHKRICGPLCSSASALVDRRFLAYPDLFIFKQVDERPSPFFVVFCFAQTTRLFIFFKKNRLTSGRLFAAPKQHQVQHVFSRHRQTARQVRPRRTVNHRWLRGCTCWAVAADRRSTGAHAACVACVRREAHTSHHT